MENPNLEPIHVIQGQLHAAVVGHHTIIVVLCTIMQLAYHTATTATYSGSQQWYDESFFRVASITITTMITTHICSTISYYLLSTITITITIAAVATVVLLGSTMIVLYYSSIFYKSL